MVNAGKSLSNGSSVGNHADGALDFSQVTTWDTLGSLVVDTTLETSGAPVDKLDSTLSLDGRNSGVDILGDDITTVHEAAGHVLSVAGVALGHHVGRLKDRASNLGDGERFVESLLSRDDGSVRSEHEVDTGVGHQVGLELGDIHVQGTIEAERRSQRTNDLSDQAVQVGVRGALDIQVATAHIVQSLVVKAESAVSVLQEGVGGENGVVRLNDGSRNLGRGRDREGKLGLASIVDGETLQKKRSKTGSSTSSSGVEDEESLESSTVISKLSDAIQNKVNNLLSDGVVTTGVVVGGILLSVDNLLRVVKLGVGSSTDFVTNSRFEIHIDSAGDVLSTLSLAEEGVERVISYTNTGIRRHGTIGGDTVLKAVQLPAAVTGLDTGLTQVDGDAFYEAKQTSVRGALMGRLRRNSTRIDVDQPRSISIVG